MKAVILAGGMQSTVNDSYEGIPKPMAEIGDKPILWHILKYLDSYGISEFIICGGYKVSMLKDYFRDYYVYASDITVDLMANTVTCHRKMTEDWKVTVVDTGLDTSVAKRILQIEDYVGEDDFLVTTGDTVSNIDIEALINTHRTCGKIMTLAVAKPMGRSALLPIDEQGNYLDKKEAALPKNQAWTELGTKVFNKRIFDYFRQDFELEPPLYERLSKDDEYAGYFHEGFWCAMETKRDKVYLTKLWNKDEAPWAIW